jgi:hypothetical protein
MAEKKKRPTRAQLDERLRNALNDVPVIGEAPEPDAANGTAPAEPHSWSRTVSRRVEGTGIAS